MRPSRGRRIGSIPILLAMALAGGCGGGDPLDGTSWRAVDAIGGRPVLEDVEATAAFSDGEVSGSSSCNSYTGVYQAGADAAGELAALSITNVGGTEMACEAPVMDQEARFVDALLSTTRYRLSGGRLELYDAQTLVLMFERTEA